MSVVTSCLDLFRDSSFNVSVGILHRTLDPGVRGLPETVRTNEGHRRL
jgi:hypothetical protein